MNINKFTQKSMEIVNNLEKTAYDFGNQELAQEHLLYNMLTVDDSLIVSLLKKMDIDPVVFQGQHRGHGHHNAAQHQVKSALRNGIHVQPSSQVVKSGKRPRARKQPP